MLFPLTMMTAEAMQNKEHDHHSKLIKGIRHILLRKGDKNVLGSRRYAKMNMSDVQSLRNMLKQRLKTPCITGLC
jgi:hypothetical protein